MECKKEGYSKKQAFTVKQRIYTEGNTKHVKLRVYFCKDCHQYHLTHQLDWEKQVSTVRKIREDID